MSTETATRTVYTADWTSGRFVGYGSHVEFRADWGNCSELFEAEEDARARYGQLVESLPSDWKREYDCSNRIFSGGFAAKLERVEEEWDEDAEEWVWVDGEVLDMRVWDGEGWFE